MMELPKLNKSTAKLNVFGPLKFNNKLESNNSMLLSSIQNDNLFFKKKLAEFEVRLDNISQDAPYDKDSENVLAKCFDRNSKFNRFRNAKLKNSKKNIKTNESYNDLATNRSELSLSARPNAANFSRKESLAALDNASPTRLNTGRSSLLTARTTESATKIDGILDNLKKHRRSAARKNAIVQSNIDVEESQNTLRPKTSAHFPQVSKNSNLNDQDSQLKALSEIRKSAKSVKKNRAKTAQEAKKDDEYCHMFYSRSWRIHPELGIIQKPDRTKYDNTQTTFYNTKKELPETFIFAPDWI